MAQGFLSRDWLPRLVARVPAPVHAKLLLAFLAIVVLLITVGAVGLRVLGGVNRRAEDLVKLQRKIAAYRQLQHDTTSQLYSVASALLTPDERSLASILRQLNQFGYDLDRLQFVAKDELELYGRVREEYERFIQVVTKAVELIRAGKVAEGRELQLSQATPLADRLERLTNQLVNKAEADMVASVEVGHEAYVTSRWMVIGFALGSVGLALILGYAISWSLIGPVKQMDARVRLVASGDFSQRLDVPNRDELGALATEFNRMAAQLQDSYAKLEQRTRELTEALEQQTATSDILRVIASSPADLQPVLDAVAENAARLCDASDAVILRADGDVLRIAAHFGSIGGPVGLEVPIDRGSVTGRAVVDRRTIHVDDLTAADDLPAGLALAKQYGHRTTLGTPLLREGVPLGVILIRRLVVRPFAEKQIKLLETFADQAVIAIENVRLFQELQARTRELARSVEELRALGEVGQAVSSTLNLETVLTTIVSRADQLSGTDGGAIYEYDESDKTLHLRATHRFEEDFVRVLRGTIVRVGEGAVGRAAATREPAQIPDILVEDAYHGPLRESMARAGFRAVLAVPLLREGRILGGLVVCRKALGAFAPEVVALLKTFATQSALAIENARLFREIEDKSRQLEAASRHKSEFLANMSHELRTPLNAIIGFSEVLQERMFGELNEKQEEYIQDIHSSGRHLLSLINDILDLSKVEAGRMELELARFDLPLALENALILVRERATRHGIALGLKVDERLGEFVGDERKIKQILLNLLSNAVKFTPEGGRITVKAVRTDGAVEITVSDTGLGIAPEDQEMIFEEFRQVGGDYLRKREGTGLGLALTRKFVELHGGKIWVTSEVGKGSTFTLTLPVRSGPEHGPQSDRPA